MTNRSIQSWQHIINSALLHNRSKQFYCSVVTGNSQRAGGVFISFVSLVWLPTLQLELVNILLIGDGLYNLPNDTEDLTQSDMQTFILKGEVKLFRSRHACAKGERRLEESCFWTLYRLTSIKNVSEAGSVSVLSPVMRLAVSKRSNTVPQDGNRSGFRNVVFFRSIRRWTKSKNMIPPTTMHHRQNPLEGWGVIYILQHILELGTKWGWVVSGTPCHDLPHLGKLLPVPIG
jgi:hypothetical protein